MKLKNNPKIKITGLNATKRGYKKYKKNKKYKTAHRYNPLNLRIKTLKALSKYRKRKKNRKRKNIHNETDQISFIKTVRLNRINQCKTLNQGSCILFKNDEERNSVNILIKEPVMTTNQKIKNIGMMFQLPLSNRYRLYSYMTRSDIFNKTKLKKGVCGHIKKKHTVYRPKMYFNDKNELIQEDNYNSSYLFIIENKPYTGGKIIPTQSDMHKLYNIKINKGGANINIDEEECENKEELCGQAFDSLVNYINGISNASSDLGDMAGLGYVGDDMITLRARMSTELLKSFINSSVLRGISVAEWFNRWGAEKNHTVTQKPPANLIRVANQLNSNIPKPEDKPGTEPSAATEPSTENKAAMDAAQAKPGDNEVVKKVLEEEERLKAAHESTKASSSEEETSSDETIAKAVEEEAPSPSTEEISSDKAIAEAVEEGASSSASSPSTEETSSDKAIAKAVGEGASSSGTNDPIPSAPPKPAATDEAAQSTELPESAATDKAAPLQPATADATGQSTELPQPAAEATAPPEPAAAEEVVAADKTALPEPAIEAAAAADKTALPEPAKAAAAAEEVAQ